MPAVPEVWAEYVNGAREVELENRESKVSWNAWKVLVLQETDRNSKD